jgi:hypothetical protein
MDSIQDDIDGAFLYGRVESTYEIYMMPFEGFEQHDPETGDIMICKLVMGLYGLVQAALLWNKELVKFFTLHGFHQCLTDPCTFVKKTDTVHIIVPVHVDDMIPTGKPPSALKEFEDALAATFAIKRLGEARWFSGIRISKTPGAIHLSQHAYADSLLSRWKMTESHARELPLKHGTDLYAMAQDDDLDSADLTDVKGFTGGYAWLADCTRPDLMYTRMLFARMQQSCPKRAFKEMTESLRYLVGTKTLGLTYFKGTAYPMRFIAFVDSGFITCPTTGRSSYCVIIFLHGGPVYWRCKLLPGRPSASTLDAEYAALHYASNDLVYFIQYATELGFQMSGPPILYCDNSASEQLAKTGRITQSNKHTNVKYHSIRYLIDKGTIELHHVPSKRNLADIGTKLFADPKQFRTYVDMLTTPVTYDPG